MGNSLVCTTLSAEALGDDGVVNRQVLRWVTRPEPAAAAKLVWNLSSIVRFESYKNRPGAFLVLSPPRMDCIRVNVTAGITKSAYIASADIDRHTCMAYKSGLYIYL